MRPYHFTLLLSLGVLVGSAAGNSARADVKLAGIFGDHMVLQQGKTLPVWGTANEGESVSVQVVRAGAPVATGKATAGNDRRWRIDLPAVNEGATVELIATAANTVKLTDVLVGDVWLCSGQSNMQYSVSKDRDGKDELTRADRPTIRLCQVGSKPSIDPLADRDMKWVLCTPETAKGFSAVGYYFAAELQRESDLPVGMIGSYVSGTPAESWTPREALSASPALTHYVEVSDAKRKSATQPNDINGGVPSSLFNGMIAPLSPFALRGVLWYQGESNLGRHEEYAVLFPALIEGWRKYFEQPELPFLFVQLPGNGDRTPDPSTSTWDMLREVQASALKLPNTGMVATIDLTPASAILHPKNKHDIGKRLALISHKVANDEDVPATGPTYETMKVEGSKVRLQMRNTAGGLEIRVPPVEDPSRPSKTPGDQLRGFAIAGADQKFVWAESKLEGDNIVLWSDKVTEPMAVRYGWGKNPEVNLYNRAGLPAAPFRTDHWPVSLDQPTTVPTKEETK